MAPDLLPAAVLRDLLADAIERPELGFRDDVFDLGADSLQVLRFCRAVGRQTPFRVRPLDVMAAPTVAALAARVSARHPSAWPATVILQAGGPAPPLFLLAAKGGHVLNYVGLARRLAGRRAVHGLHSAGLVPGHRPLRTMRGIAADAARRIVSRTGGADCLVGGMSYGAVAAHAVAGQLERVHHVRVRLVALIAPSPVRTDRSPLPFDEREFWRAELGDRVPLGSIDGPRRRRVAAIVDTLLRDGALPERYRHFDRRSAVRHLLVELANVEALDGHVARPCAAPVVLFQPRHDPAVARQEVIASWRSLVPDLVTHEVDGEHHTVLLDGSRARAIGAAIEEAARRCDRTGDGADSPLRRGRAPGKGDAPSSRR